MRLRENFKWATSFFVAVLCGCAAPSDRAERFVIHYYNPVGAAQLADYGLLVLDPDAYPNVAQFEADQTTLGYVSLGEAKPGVLGPQDQHMVVRQNPIWKSDVVDIRSAQWQHRILRQTIPKVLNAGYSGLMFDTIDSALHLEQTEPDTYAGTTDAALFLLKQIRQQYPQAKLMLNRGMPIWEKAAPYLDMILLESTASDYDFARKQAHLRPQEQYEAIIAQTRVLQQKYPHLRFYSVDYWNMQDTDGVSLLYQKQRKNNVTPYVTTPDLGVVHPEPAPSPWPSMKNQRALYGGFDA